MIMQEQVYSIEEAARLLKVHPDTIRRMIKRGEMQSRKVGRQYRIPRSEIEKFLGAQPKDQE
jgi:excisionase family DNA binding protein